MRSNSTRLGAVFAVLVALSGVFAGTVAAAPAPEARAAATSFTVNNGASFKLNPARGSLLALFFDGDITTEVNSFSPWVETTNTGVYVQINDCRNRALVRKLPILYVSPRQLNVYLPDRDGFERYGTCRNSGNDVFTVHMANGQDISQLQPTPEASPGVFMNDNGGGAFPLGWLHIVANDTYVPLSSCNTISACPYATNGTLNELVMLMTGSERLGGFTFSILNANRDVQFVLTGQGLTESNGGQRLTSLCQRAVPEVNFAYTEGIEVATVGLTEVIPGAGAYQLTMITSVAPFRQGPLQILLSPPNVVP